MTTSNDDRPRPRVLTLLFDGVEEIEAIAPVDLLPRAAIVVVMASVNEQQVVEGRSGIRIQTEKTWSEIENEPFDLLFIPGGPGVFALFENEAILQIIRQRNQNAQWTAAICAAPKLLAAAGILENRTATSHGSIRPELPISSDERIVVSDHIITSQGAGTAIEFGLQLIETLTDQKTAQSIAQSIHF
ncbi:MAG: DJ-1/PfpI family protein [Opitutales bacterium]|nr:DJ-1/PfpI family protein [Opitutales bacterium]